MIGKKQERKKEPIPVPFADYRDVIADTLSEFGKRFGAMSQEAFQEECRRAFHEIGRSENGRFLRFYLAQNALLNRNMALNAKAERKEDGGTFAAIYSGFVHLLQLVTPKQDAEKPEAG